MTEAKANVGHGMGVQESDWHMCDGTIDMEAYIGIVGILVYCNQDDVFHGKSLVIKSRLQVCSTSCSATQTIGESSRLQSGAELKDTFCSR